MNGGTPVSISYVTQATLYMSLRASTTLFASICSGLMYTGVPMTNPAPVILLCSITSTATAIPKSVTTA